MYFLSLSLFQLAMIGKLDKPSLSRVPRTK